MHKTTGPTTIAIRCDPPKVAAVFVGSFLLLAAGSAARAASEFDGTWRVELDYTSASQGNPACVSFDPSHELKVQDGSISGSIRHRQAGLFTVDGTVSADGQLVADAKGHETVRFTGKLAGQSGEGKWEAQRSHCDGSWSAIRK